MTVRSLHIAISKIAALLNNYSNETCLANSCKGIKRRLVIVAVGRVKVDTIKTTDHFNYTFNANLSDIYLYPTKCFHWMCNYCLF
jgi:hypothetical protein